MITVDKRQVPWTEGLTLEAVARQCGLAASTKMLAVDGTVISPRDWGTCRIADGAVVTIWPVMSGG